MVILTKYFVYKVDLSIKISIQQNAYCNENYKKTLLWKNYFSV